MCDTYGEGQKSSVRSPGRVRETATPRSPVSCSGLHLPLGLTPPDPPHPRPHLGQPPSAACGGLSLRGLRHGMAVCLGSFACGFMVTSGRLNATASSNTGTQMPLGVAAGLVSGRSPWPARLGGDRCWARSVPPHPTPPHPAPPRTWAAPAFGRAGLCSPGSEAPGCQGSPSPARLCGGSCLCGFGVFPWLLTWSAPFHTFICWVRFRSCAAADGVLRPPPPWFPTRPRHRAPGAHISPLQGQLFAHGRKLMWLNLFIFPVG